MSKIFKNQVRFNSTRIILTGIAVLAVVLALFLIQHSKKEDTIKIGAIVSLSGPAWYHKDASDGMLLAVGEINFWGGVNGRKIELIIEDNKTDPEVGKKAFNKIEATHHPVLYISTTSDVSMALAPLARKNEVVLVGLIAVTPKLKEQNEWVFKYFTSPEIEIIPILTILKELNAKSLGILYMNDEYGTSVFELLKNKFEKIGGKVQSKNFGKGCSDFKEHISKLKYMEAIFTVGFASHLKNVFQQLREEDFNGLILGPATATWPPVRKMQYTNGVYVAAPMTYNQNNIFAKETKEKYEKKYNKPFNHYAANGYDFIKILAGLLEDKEISRGNIKSLLEGGFIYSGLFGDIDLKPGEHSINFPLFPAQIIDGEVKYMYWR